MTRPELSATPVTVVHHSDRGRYELFSDEDPPKLLGFLAYQRLDDSTIELQHTIISEDYSRQGLARTLVTLVLDELRVEGQNIVPTCTYVQSFLDRYPDYSDLVVAG